jgi:membrane-associated protease RseP (regulator of RpoE activity)
MKTGWWTSMGWGLALAGWATVGTASTVSGQVGDRDCRCVDADGNAIDNCTCVVMPDVPRMMALRDGSFRLPLPPNRPRIGVSVDAGQDDAVSAQGARVTAVMEDGPAAEAGLQEGDVLTHVDGRSLLEPLGGDIEREFDLDRSLPVQRLLAIARDLDSGANIEVRYLRDGRPMTATVTVQDLGAVWGMWAEDLRADLAPRLEELREQLREQRLDLEQGHRQMMIFDGNGARAMGLGRAAGLGISMIEVRPGLGAYFGTDRGVLVTEVDEVSGLGLQEGDVILRIGDREVGAPAQARRILASYGNDEEVRMRVLRQGTEIDVSGRLRG